MHPRGHPPRTAGWHHIPLADAHAIVLRFCGLLRLLLLHAPEDAGGDQECLLQVNRKVGFWKFRGSHVHLLVQTVAVRRHLRRCPFNCPLKPGKQSDRAGQRAPSSFEPDDVANVILVPLWVIFRPAYHAVIITAIRAHAPDLNCLKVVIFSNEVILGRRVRGRVTCR